MNSYAVGEAPNVRLRGHGTDRNYYPNLCPRRRTLGVCAHSVGIHSYVPNSHAFRALVNQQLMQHYQTITVEPHVPRRIFLPAGALLGVSDPEGGQPFALGLEEGGALEVVSSTAPSLRAGDLLRRQVEIKADTYTGAALTLRAAQSQWVEVGTTASAAQLTPESALRVRLPLALPDGPYADLPLPLASVVAEYRIDGATALTYLVKAGQFIEIVNV